VVPAVLVRDGVLDHQRSQSIWMRQRQAETDGSAIVLHKKALTVDVETLREMLDDLCEVVEGVVERRGARCISVTESQTVGSHQMTGIGQTAQERFIHPRGRWKAVKEEKGWSIRTAASG
jgi:hypothetical protein